MNRVINLLVTLVLLAAVVLVWFWSRQNADQVALLRLDLGRYVGAWEMTTPMGVPSLMGASFGAGALFASVFFLAWGMANRRRAETAERDALLGGRY